MPASAIATPIVPSPVLPRAITDEERYLFDLNGFVVLEDALERAQVRALNAVLDRETMAIDDAATAAGKTRPKHHMFHDCLGMGSEMRALIDHAPLMPYMEEWLGADFHLDHDYAFVTRAGSGDLGDLHGGAAPHDPCMSYGYHDGRIRSNLTVVSYALADIPPGAGGLCVIPGSHKANRPLPWSGAPSRFPDLVRHVSARAGSAIIFTEAAAHGTLPWTAAHERRTLFYKYSPRAIQWIAKRYDPTLYPDLSERQRRMLRPAHAQWQE